jgi:hypothetical protein
MKHLVRYSVVLICLVLAVSAAQAQWRELYATTDDDINGTGTNTPSVGVIHNDMFVALASSFDAALCTECFLIVYVNADSVLGRVNYYGYGGDVEGIFKEWSDGAFDNVQMFGAWQVFATPDSFIYVANNDPNHNILVFKIVPGDTAGVVPVGPAGDVYPRNETGVNSLWGITVDLNGYVYVVNDTSFGVTDDIKIYKPINEWTNTHADAPIQTINLPDSYYKGIAVSPDGAQLFVSDHAHKRVLKFVGSPTAGYSQAMGFNFELTEQDTIPTTGGRRAGPIGLGFLPEQNILAVACDTLRSTGVGYQYARIYFLNTNDGSFISPDTSMHMMNVARWNFELTGGYQNRSGGTTPGNASGYASTFDVKFDELGNLYSQSYYGWTVEKWVYDGQLPVFTDVEPIPAELPQGYRLTQNYPNPFNPSTTIEFAIPQSGYVTLKVHDLLGREVATLVDDTKEAGTYRAVFDAREFPSGVYFYTLKAGSFTDVRRMVLLK